MAYQNEDKHITSNQPYTQECLNRNKPNVEIQTTKKQSLKHIRRRITNTYSFARSWQRAPSTNSECKGRFVRRSFYTAFAWPHNEHLRPHLHNVDKSMNSKLDTFFYSPRLSSLLYLFRYNDLHVLKKPLLRSNMK